MKDGFMNELTEAEVSKLLKIFHSKTDDQKMGILKEALDYCLIFDMVTEEELKKARKDEYSMQEMATKLLFAAFGHRKKVIIAKKVLFVDEEYKEPDPNGPLIAASPIIMTRMLNQVLDSEEEEDA